MMQRIQLLIRNNIHLQLETVEFYFVEILRPIEIRYIDKKSLTVIHMGTTSGDLILFGGSSIIHFFPGKVFTDFQPKMVRKIPCLYKFLFFRQLVFFYQEISYIYCCLVYKRIRIKCMLTKMILKIFLTLTVSEANTKTICPMTQLKPNSV